MLLGLPQMPRLNEITHVIIELLTVKTLQQESMLCWIILVRERVGPNCSQNQVESMSDTKGIDTEIRGQSITAVLKSKSKLQQQMVLSIT